ncbi:hypothetical protein CYLTODRAFT_489111 [Cylindrobasidium torrendii FP15055 ss-10]|uniref:Uncharacterized protein n=1 Tax=Cylindrobasidium torrendii FP15055 ss-10 TaxID=1314674 RepID=A0A0D7BGJ0_9AGAR|nr:hypothetical protein CYLTODRAFT_489111 [Cylindrobasidium torrendii FP15055 ss-10]
MSSVVDVTTPHGQLIHLLEIIFHINALFPLLVVYSSIAMVRLCGADYMLPWKQLNRNIFMYLHVPIVVVAYLYYRHIIVPRVKPTANTAVWTFTKLGLCMILLHLLMMPWIELSYYFGQWALLLSPVCALWDIFAVRRMPDLIGMDSPEVVALANDDVELGSEAGIEVIVEDASPKGSMDINSVHALVS